MTDNSRLNELLDRWEDARENGESISLEEVCKDHPELLTSMKQKIAALDAFEQCVASNKSPTPFENSLDDESTHANSLPQSLEYQSNLIDLIQHDRGGLGVVYRAVDEKLNRNVAIKFIQPRHARNQNLTERFLQEAEITGRLDHPGVVPVYALGQTDSGQPFYSMRFIRGESLDSQIKRYHQSKGEFDPGEQRLRMRQMLGNLVSVCRTIAYAHTRGIVHRDIKPQNIMLGKHGEALVVDWGLALPIGRGSKFRVTDEQTLRPVLTSELYPDMGEGTPVYMSPEQAAGQDTISPASDIYSLGVTLYKLLTGELAFDGANPMDVRSKIIAGDFQPPKIHAPSLARPLESICLKAMALAPCDRYETATDLADDLESWLAENRVQAHTYSRRERVLRWCRRHLGLIAGLTAGLVLLSAGLMIASGLVMRLTKQKIRLQGNAIQALQMAQANQLDGINMTCRVAAKSVRLTMEASVWAIEDLAKSQDLVDLLSERNSAIDPDVADARQAQLESLLVDARCCDAENLQAISWFALDRNGQLLARSSDSSSAIKVNRPFWMRPYFHGGESSLDPNLPSEQRPGPITHTNITPMFIGKGKGWKLCSISTPVRDADKNVVGVIGLTMRAGRLDAVEQLGTSGLKRSVTMVETRGQNSARLIHHPGMATDSDTANGSSTGETSNDMIDDDVLAQLKAIDIESTDPILLDDYVDPIEPESETGWVAVAAPVHVRSREYGPLKLGWYLIVQDQPYNVPLQ